MPLQSPYDPLHFLLYFLGLGWNVKINDHAVASVCCTSKNMYKNMEQGACTLNSGTLNMDIKVYLRSEAHMENWVKKYKVQNTKWKVSSTLHSTAQHYNTGYRLQDNVLNQTEEVDTKHNKPRVEYSRILVEGSVKKCIRFFHTESHLRSSCCSVSFSYVNMHVCGILHLLNGECWMGTGLHIASISSFQLSIQ